MKILTSGFTVLLLCLGLAVFEAEKKNNLNDIPSDIVVPK